MVVGRLMRAMRMGKYKHFAGVDLEGNQFFDFPNPRSPTDWRHAKRTVEYARKLPLSEYGAESIPPQWLSWLRRTRKDPPTIDELESDRLRRLRLEENVRKLEEAYRDEKRRLAEETRNLIGTSRAHQEQEQEQQEQEQQPAETTTEQQIEERKLQEEREKNALRRQFVSNAARQNPDRPAGTGGQQEAEGWQPRAARRRSPSS